MDLLEKCFEWYALGKLKKIFAHRQQATIEYLSNPSQVNKKECKNQNKMDFNNFEYLE